MKIFRPILYAAFPFLAQSSLAQTPTWSSDIAPIIYNNCATCHRSGGIAPFALMTYSDAVAQAYAINSDVQSGSMPPWPPDPSYNHLAHERLLSAVQKAKITAWVMGGTPQGNPALAPPQPVFSNNGDIPGTANLTVQIPTYTSPAATTDMYRCFVLDANQSVDKYIMAFEAIPGNRGIVHHVLVFADTTGTCAQLDAADPGPGYTSFGGVGTNSAILLGGWVPGSSPVMYPSGFGVRMPHNAKIVVQIHYPSGTSGQVDSTRIRFFFSPVAVRDVYIQPVLNYYTNINTPINIPANTVRSFTEHYTTPGIALSLLGIAPHMHLLGRTINAFGITPQADTQKYISIPDWEFHWQGFYLMKKIVKIPGGTNIYSNAIYDNTVNNPDNPSSPPQNVHAGESTTDEMMLTFAVFSIYQPGDENIVIDSGSNSPTAVSMQPYYKATELLQPYPVPAGNEVIAKMYFDHACTASLDLINFSGQVVQSVFKNQVLGEGYHTYPVALNALAEGIYQLRLNYDGGMQMQKIIVAR